jgi:hypothetical protein
MDLTGVLLVAIDGDHPKVTGEVEEERLIS